MKIRDGIKFGLGFYIATAITLGVTGVIDRIEANDDEWMERLKNQNPTRYEKLLKYRTK